MHLPKTVINWTTPSRKCHAVFHSFLSEDRKQYATTTTAHSKCLISLLKDKKVLTKPLSTIYGNTDGCAEQYRCTSALYLMSVMSQYYSIIIDRGISGPGQCKEVVDGLNSVDKRYICQLMYNIQLPGSNIIDSQMQMYTGNQK